MWEAVVGSITSFVIVIDCDYTILFVNQVEDGDSIKDAIGANALDFVQPEYKERVSQAYDLAFAGKDLTEFEVASWDPAGNPTYYTSRIAPIVENGKVVAGLITCMNVQNIKDTEASLRADRRALRHLITVVDDGAGFDMSAVPDGRFGLESIRQRSRLFSREAAISSCPGKGSRVEVVLPIFPCLQTAMNDAGS